MPWHVGIDEAGYGPNLGPLLQCGVAFHSVQEPCDLWQELAAIVRRKSGPRDARLIIDDSKKVYGGSKQLASLERGVLATLAPCHERPIGTVHQLIAQFAPEAMVELEMEPWFVPDRELPIAVNRDEIAALSERFHGALTEAGCSSVKLIGRVTPPSLFNAILDQRGNKADVLTHGLRWVIQKVFRDIGGTDSLRFFIDRQGGRVYHQALLTSIYDGGQVEIAEEGPERCVYRAATPRDAQWTFEVEADSKHFEVALASMASKYIREVLMMMFNDYWQHHVPGLKPTAGYPVDAARFIAEIRPVMNDLKINERSVWRRK